MNHISGLTCMAISVVSISLASGQETNNLNLSTRWTGQPPKHETVSSTAQWLQNAMNVKLEVAITNLYADSNACLEIQIGDQRLTFPGAGTDGLGNYIPTNYAPVEVNTSLRHLYSMRAVCPNSGPSDLLFQVGDIGDPCGLGGILSTSAPPAALSTFLWTNFTAAAQYSITNDTQDTDPGCPIAETNLVEQLDRIIVSGTIWDSNRFAGVVLSQESLGLLAETNPPEQDIILLNRSLLHDALGLRLPCNPNPSGTANIYLYVQPPNRLISNPLTTRIPPPAYFVQVGDPSAQYPGNGVAEVYLANPDGGYLSTNFTTVEAFQSQFAHFGLGDGCDDARLAPGVGKWLAMGPGCTSDTNAISLEWGVSLGRNSDGIAAGQLTFNENELSSDSYTPEAIFYNCSLTNLYTTLTLGSPYVIYTPTNCYPNVLLVMTNVAIVESNESGVGYTRYDALLRQVDAYQTFVDILSTNPNETILNFYHPYQVGTNQDQNGLYTNFSGSPFVTWTLLNPNPGSCSGLDIIEDRDGVLSTQFLAETASPGGVTWTLTQGSGSATRVETRQVSFSGGSPPTDRIEVNTISYTNSGVPAYRCQETYHFYPWGSELAKTTIPIGAAGYSTAYDYYTNTDGSDPGNPLGIGYSMVKLITYPDGYWEQRLYGVPDVRGDGDLVDCQVLHPYFDGANGGDISPNYANPDPANTAAEDIWYYTTGNQNGQDIYQFDHGKETQWTWSGTQPGGGAAYTQPDTAVNESWSENGPADSEDEHENDIQVGWYENWTYTALSAPGLAGHSQIGITTFLYKQFFYDQGAFDASANVFYLDSANHLYTWDGIANQYPDHMETEIDGPTRSEGDDGGYTPAYGFPGETPGYIPSIDYYSDFDDQELASPEGGTSYLAMYPGATHELRRIYQGGSLAQTEDYVYLGAGETDPDSGISSDPQFALLKKVRYYVDSLGHPTNVVSIDPASSQRQTLYTASYKDANGQDGELLMSETDENGQQTCYTYDGLQRIQTMTVKGYGAQPDQATTYTYDANGQVLNETIASGGLTTSESWAYDLAGRTTNQLDQSGIATETSYSSDNLTTTTTSPGGIQVVQANGLDRFPASVTGNGTVQKFFEHDTAPFSPIYVDALENPAMREQTTFLGNANSPRWQTQGSDCEGNSDAWAAQPAGSGTTNTIATLRYYGDQVLINDKTAYGNQTFLSHARNFDVGGSVCFAGTNDGWFWSDTTGRNVATIRNIISLNGVWYQAATNFVYLADNSVNGTVQSIHLEQLNGFGPNESACSIDYDADMNVTTNVTYIDRNDNLVTTVTTEPYTSTLSATNVYQNGRLISSSTLSVASPTHYYYDALGRTNQITDALGNSSYMSYDPNTGWLTSMMDPAGNTTYYFYYGPTEANAGKLKCQTDPNGKNTWYAYTPQGQLYRTWGDVPYPAEYRYNEYGDLTNLITFQGGSGWNSSTWPNPNDSDGNNTYWEYDEASGALLKKIDAKGNATTYTYDTNTGALFTRSWSRTVGGINVTVTNYYDGFQDLVEQDYNDGTPSVYFNNYNRAGQPREIVDASGTTELTYDYASRLVSSSCASGMMAGVSVNNHFNPDYGRDSVSVQGLSSSLQDNFGYDAYGRLGSVSSGNCSATYGYVPNSDLLQSTTCKNGSTTVLTTTRGWQYGYRLGSIANVVGSTTVTSHNYAYDSVNRRTSAQLEDGSIWKYGYDDRNEVTGANRYWSDGTAVSGQQYSYAYDNIGNRQSATFGGDINGANLQTVSYTVNSLNQYVDILTPGEKEIMGVAYANNSVAVNGRPADRKGQYFHREISVANTNAPVWQNVTNISGVFTNKGGAVFPANNQALAYDADGNLSSDGVWFYQWDGENRLICMTNAANIGGIANSNRLQMQFAYDYMGRRIEKIVSAWNQNQGAFVPQSTNYFVYDGWNLLATLGPGSSVLQSFMWGNDMSGTMIGAGGVGGLLMADFPGTNCFAAYDGNGNITALIGANDLSTAACYEYSPYGELIRETGLFARENPFRFSTKFWDEESGLIFYGYRYYNSVLGRWVNEDPSGESGSVNLLLFAVNDSINKFDLDGHAPVSLGDLAAMGPVATVANWLLTASSACVPPPLPGSDTTGKISAMNQFAAVVLCVGIDAELGGKLLENVGGPAVFASLFAAGQGAGYVPKSPFLNRTQSLVAAVVAGRLDALSLIGQGASDVLSGRGPGGDFGEEAGFDFARDLQNGDDTYLQIDAVDVGVAVYTDQARSGVNAASFLDSLLCGDAAGAFASLPDYDALNAWNMADSLGD